MDIESKLKNLEKQIDNLEVPIGYGVSGASLSTPLWIDALTPYLEFTVLVCGVIIGISTVYLQIRKIRKSRDKDGAS